MYAVLGWCKETWTKCCRTKQVFYYFQSNRNWFQILPGCIGNTQVNRSFLTDSYYWNAKQLLEGRIVSAVRKIIQIFYFAFSCLLSFLLQKKRRKKKCRGRWLDNGWLEICFPSDKWTDGGNGEKVAIRIKYITNDITAAETTHTIVNYMWQFDSSILHQTFWSSERTLKVVPLSEENNLQAYFWQPLEVKEFSNMAASTWSGQCEQSR